MNKEINYIDIQVILNIIKKRYLFIILGSIILYFITQIIVKQIPDEFIASGIYQTNNPDQYNNLSSQSSVPSLGGIASFAGINLSSRKNYDTYVLEIIKSKDFFFQLLSKAPSLKKRIFAVEGFDHEAKQEKFNTDFVSINEGLNWLSLNNSSLEPSDLTVYYAYRSSLYAEIDKKSGFVEISFTHRSPLLVYDLLNILQNELNSSLRSKNLNESNQKIQYFKRIINEEGNIDLSNTINYLIYEELKKIALINTNKEYVLESIETPVIPEFPSSPNRSFIKKLSIVLALFISIVFTILFSYRDFDSEIANNAE